METTTKNNIKVLSAFTFDTQIVRAEEVDGKRYLIGCASSTSRDTFDTIFSKDCQEGFIEDCANTNEIIKVDMFHNNQFIFQVGKVIEAYTQYEEDSDKTFFYSKIMLKRNNVFANQVYEDLTSTETEFGDPPKIGLSISGDVVTAHYERIDGKITKVYDRVKLKKIAITDRPSNPDTFLEAVSRSLDNTNILDITNEEKINMSDLSTSETTEVENVEQTTITEKVETIDRESPTVTSLFAKINETIIEFMDQVKLIQNTPLTAENAFRAIRFFVENYEDRLEEIACMGVWYMPEDDRNIERQSEIENEMKNLVKTLSESKNNFSEAIDARINELVVSREKESTENVEQINNQEKGTNQNVQIESNTTSNSSDSEAGQTSINRESSTSSEGSECSISKQEDAVINPEMTEEVKTEVEVISRETIETEVKKIAESISREIAEKFDIKITELTDANNTLKTNYETVSRELEELRNSPSSSPANTVFSQVVNQDNKTIVREKLKSTDRKTVEAIQSEVMKNFWQIR